MQAVQRTEEAREAPAGRGPGRSAVRWTSVVAGLGGSLAMATLYAIVVIGASGSIRHFADQVATDWYLLLPIVAGFGVQVGLLVELRRRQRLLRSVATAGAAGAGASTLGMVACCAHHLADLVPFLGATAAATFLYDYRLPFMVVGLGLNAVAITVATRRLRSIPLVRLEVDHACEPDGSSH